MPPAVASAIVPLTVAPPTVPPGEALFVLLPTLLLPVVPDIDTLPLSTVPPAEAPFVLLPTLLLPVVPLMLTVALFTVTVVPLLWPAARVQVRNAGRIEHPAGDLVPPVLAISAP